MPRAARGPLQCKGRHPGGVDRDRGAGPRSKVFVRPSRHGPVSRGWFRHLAPSGDRGAIDGGVVAGVQWPPVRE